MSTSGSDIRGQVHALVAAVAPGGAVDVHDGLTLVGDLGFESVEILKLVCRIERAFGIVVDARSVAPIETVGDLVDAVAARVISE